MIKGKGNFFNAHAHSVISSPYLVFSEFIALVRKLRIEIIAQTPVLGGFLTRLRPIRCGYGYSGQAN
jgi:hypothetical protein